MPSKGNSRAGGFTLVELVIVVAVIAIIATMAVSRMSGAAGRAKTVAAESDLRAIAAAFTDPETGYLRDMGGIPGFSPAHLRLANLLVPTNLYGSADAFSRDGGVRLDDVRRPGCAAPSEFVRWSDESGRGWRGPYVRHGFGAFPGRDAARFADDETFGSRGFYPGLWRLRLPPDFTGGLGGCSVYGFPGEPAIFDPWGNPYVLQVPPPQAFPDAGRSATNVTDETRFRYARVVSAGPDGRLQTPCFGENTTNWWATSWSDRACRLRRQAGLIDGGDRGARGDDIVLFLWRNDVDEGEAFP